VLVGHPVNALRFGHLFYVDEIETQIFWDAGVKIKDQATSACSTPGADSSSVFFWLIDPPFKSRATSTKTKQTLMGLVFVSAIKGRRMFARRERAKKFFCEWFGRRCKSSVSRDQTTGSIRRTPGGAQSKRGLRSWARTVRATIRTEDSSADPHFRAQADCEDQSPFLARTAGMTGA